MVPQSRMLRSIGLFAILALAGWLRLDWSDPPGDRMTFLRNDESHYTRLVVQFLGGNWRVDYFINPTLPMYIMYAVTVVVGSMQVIGGGYESFADFVFEASLDPYWTTIVGRWCTSVAGILGVYLTYVVGRRMFGTAVGLIAGLGLALDSTHVHRSVLAGNETMLVVAVLSFFLAVLRFVERPTARRHIACGILLGLTAATKYNGGIHLFTLIGASLLVVLRNRGASPARPALGPHVYAGFVAAPLGFLAGSPGVVTNFGRFVSDFRTQASFLSEGYGTRRLGWHYYPTEFAEANVGALFAVLCGAGLLLAAWRAFRFRDERAWLLLLATAPSYLVLGPGIFAQMRFLLPAIPFLLILGSWALTALLEWVLGRTRRSTSRDVTAAAAVTLAVLLLWPHVPVVQAVSKGPFGQPDERAELLDWLLESVDPDEPCLDFISQAHCNFFSLPSVLRAVPEEQPRSRDEIRDRLLGRSLRTRPLHTLVQRSPDFESFMRAIETREERYLILSLWSQRVLREPVDVQAHIRRLLRGGRRMVPGCTYWRKAVRSISRWERLGHRIGSERKRLVCIVKLPRPGDSPETGQDE